MLHFKSAIFLGVLLSLAGGCDHSQFAEGPTSNLKPDNVKEFAEERKLATKMLSSVLTRLPNGQVSAVIHRQNDKAKIYLTVNHSEKTLHKLCLEQETCIGGVYASVLNNNKNKGEILHRVHKTKKMVTTCAWLELYSSKFGVMDEALQQEVIGRSWHWVKECFKE